MTADQPRADAIAALQTLETYIIRCGDPATGTPTWQEAMDARDTLFAALTPADPCAICAVFHDHEHTLPVPADPTADLRAALDVDLLTEAEWTVDQGNWFIEKSDAQEWAEEVAAEYARLLAASTTEDET